MLARHACGVRHQVYTASLPWLASRVDTGGRNSEVEPLPAASFAAAAGWGDGDRIHIACRSMNNPDRLHEQRAERAACEPHSGWEVIIGQVGANCPAVDQKISRIAGGNPSCAKCHAPLCILKSLSVIEFYEECRNRVFAPQESSWRPASR